jgi:hypothetical protein
LGLTFDFYKLFKIMLTPAYDYNLGHPV